MSYVIDLSNNVNILTNISTGSIRYSEELRIGCQKIVTESKSGGNFLAIRKFKCI